MTISFLVTILTKALLHQLISLAMEASSRKSPGCSKHLPLWITEATCFSEPAMQQNFSKLIPICVVLCNPVSELYRQFFFFDLRSWSLQRCKKPVMFFVIMVYGV